MHAKLLFLSSPCRRSSSTGPHCGCASLLLFQHAQNPHMLQVERLDVQQFNSGGFVAVSYEVRTAGYYAALCVGCYSSTCFVAVSYEIAPWVADGGLAGACMAPALPCVEQHPALAAGAGLLPLSRPHHCPSAGRFSAAAARAETYAHSHCPVLQARAAGIRCGDGAGAAGRAVIPHLVRMQAGSPRGLSHPTVALSPLGHPRPP